MICKYVPQFCTKASSSDGNGRTSRLLMNLDLMNHGYNPVIIKKEDGLEYYEALDKVHTTVIIQILLI